MMLCRFVQAWMSLHEDMPAAQSGWCARHLASCARCRTATERTRRLVSRLERTAASWRQPVPPFLVGRIIAAVRTDDRAARPNLGMGWNRRVWTLGMVALMLIVGIAFWPWKSGESAQPAGMTLVARQSAKDESKLTLALPAGKDLLAYGARLDEPLEREWQRVVADARTAARSLAAAFVPENTLAWR